MEDVRPFLLFIHKFIDLTEDEFDRWIRPYLKVRKVPKKKIVTRKGEIEPNIYYVIKGLVRKYYKQGRQEFTSQISSEGHLIHSQESFHSRTPSEYTVETIEDSILIYMSYEDLQQVYTKDCKMERMGRLVATFTMVLKDRTQIDLIRLNPRERFIDFVQKNPMLVQRVPQKVLASYLNIKPETFSRFKHLLKKGNNTTRI